MGASLHTPGGDDEETSYKPVAEINITPFVDVMLVLLIIFMVAAPLLVSGVPVNLPSTTQAKSAQPQKPIIVTLNKDRDLFLRETPVASSALVGELKQLKASEGDTVVYVRADQSIPYGEVMGLLDRVGASGFQRISLLSNHKSAASNGGQN